MKKYDCIVIGAGASGCTAALLLAKCGKKVALVESHHTLMPLLKRFKRQGFWCDPGFHYTGGLHEDGKMNVFMRYFGMDDLIKPVMMDPDGFDAIRFKDREYAIPWGMDRLHDYLCSEFPKSKPAIEKYLTYFHDLNMHTAFTNYDLPYGSYPEDLIESKSLYRYLRENGAEKELIQLLGTHGYIVYGADMTSVPTFMNAYIMWSFYNGTGNLVHGGDALHDAFSKRLTEEGVDILLKSPVTEINIDSSRRVKGVEIAGEMRLECDHCISTVHPHKLLDIFPQKGIKPAFRKRVQAMENSLSFATIFYKCENIPESLKRRNLYEYLPERRGSLEGIHAIMKTSPEERNALTVILPVAEKEIDDLFAIDRNIDMEKYQTMKQSFAERADRALFGRFPELRGHAEIIDVSTPVTYNRYTGTPRGTAYGLKQTNQYFALSSRAPVQGLYLAGQSLNPGVLGAIVTSFIATGFIVDPETIWKEIRKCR